MWRFSPLSNWQAQRHLHSSPGTLRSSQRLQRKKGFVHEFNKYYEHYVLVVKNLPADVGDVKHGFSPLVEKIPAGGNSSPLQYSCLEKLMDRGL